ncbi:MAG: oligopeptide transporter, OPT family [Oligoflexia bacterium]|nr:oligopeptide transporter, OPT family [Oligoflexia bacterium]
MSQSEVTEHKPYISDSKNIPELTLLPILIGVVLGIIFGASSLYLALKVGMTVSASIPVAVLSITIFRAISKAFGIRRATILENNIVMTTGSAGESIAFGVAVTMPALLILGYNMEITRIMLVSILGGLLGVLMMIPLRWALIVRGHKELVYPEGTACAEVLIVGEEGGTSAKTVFTGFFLGLFYKIANVGMKLWKDVPEKTLTWYKGSSFATEVSPELLGVGYIIGPRIACIMVAGGILSSFVLSPAIVLFGSGLTTPLYPATKLISEMSVHEIWRSYVLYIGAGAVAAGGIISLFQSLPVIVRSFGAGLKSLKKSGVKTTSTRRTELDIPMNVVLGGVLLLVLAIWAAPALKVNLLGALLIVVFGFLFVTVSSRLTGEIGSSSNPISGMTVATLLLTCLIFVMIGWVGVDYRVTALSIAAIVCIAASNGGTTSQDLKTGYLVGATPRAQQIGLLIGALTSAIVIGYTLLLLNDASTIYAKKSFPGQQFNISELPTLEKVGGPEGKNDSNEYHVLQLPEPRGEVPAGKYLVDGSGQIVYLVDPGINGVLQKRDDGTSVQKYEAPKARLMSLIIDGILTQKLPWSLVLLGVFIAVVLEFCGIASLPFAVGVYLPLAASAPIFFGGFVRWLVDKMGKRKAAKDSESQAGILLSSGLIAGGSIAGIGIAILSLNENWTSSLDMSKVLPGLASSDGLAYLIFFSLMGFVYLVGREKILKPGRK